MEPQDYSEAAPSKEPSGRQFQVVKADAPSEFGAIVVPLLKMFPSRKVEFRWEEFVSKCYRFNCLVVRRSLRAGDSSTAG